MHVMILMNAKLVKSAVRETLSAPTLVVLTDVSALVDSTKLTMDARVRLLFVFMIWNLCHNLQTCGALHSNLRCNISLFSFRLNLSALQKVFVVW